MTDRIEVNWQESVLYSECTWHQLSPYVGRMKSTMARDLVAQFSEAGDTIYDPFCGAGTVALEAWTAGRNVLAGDLSPYAWVLSKAKLSPPQDLAEALARLERYWDLASEEQRTIDLRKVPRWVRLFYHAETLREALGMRNVLVRGRQWFLLACLLGILHHWRPGFLSYPSSHTVPHLMDKRYPRSSHPDKYTYRETRPRLLAKVRRAFARTPEIDRRLRRTVERRDATSIAPSREVPQLSAVITSPPYMNSLSYARDNRLRLWFLGVTDHRPLERRLSPRREQFFRTMRKLLRVWAGILPKDGPCVLVLGSVRRGGRYHDLPSEILALVRQGDCQFRVTSVCKNVVPENRKSWVNCRSTRQDTILVLRKSR